MVVMGFPFDVLMDGYSSMARFYCEQADAVHPVFEAGVAGLSGQESVRIGPGRLDRQVGGLDEVSVDVLLDGAADTGGPEIGVADDCLGELSRGDDVGDRESATGA